MAELREHIQHTLDESRMLILGAQVLIGFASQAAFQKGFAELPSAFQIAGVASLCALVLTVALLIAPSAYHRIVFGGRDDERVDSVGTMVLTAAPLPLGAALGADLAIAGARAGGPGVGWIAGVAAAVMALGLFYGPRLLRARGREHGDEGGEKPSKLNDRVKHVLTEARVVLPGAQALLGFGLIIALSERFRELSDTARAVHLASVGLIALSIVLLMSPAAYHRIVLGGEVTPRLEKVASRFVLAGMAPLALSLAGDLYLVVLIVTGSARAGAIAAAAAAVVFLAMWYAVPLAVKARSRTP